MKQILVMIAAVGLVGCSNDTPEAAQVAQAEAQVTPAPSPEPDPAPAEEKLIADPIVEGEVRDELEKPEGELTEADLEKVTGEIWLSGTQITDAGIKEMAKSQQLGTLFLTDTQITDAGLKDVAKLQKLERLSLFGTKVTEAGVAELKKALPNCEISGP